MPGCHLYTMTVNAEKACFAFSGITSQHWCPVRSASECLQGRSLQFVPREIYASWFNLLCCAPKLDDLTDLYIAVLSLNFWSSKFWTFPVCLQPHAFLPSQTFSVIPWSSLATMLQWHHVKCRFKCKHLLLSLLVSRSHPLPQAICTLLAASKTEKPNRIQLSMICGLSSRVSTSCTSLFIYSDSTCI